MALEKPTKPTKDQQAAADAAAVSASKTSAKDAMNTMIDDALRGGPVVHGQSPAAQARAKANFEKANFMREPVKQIVDEVNAAEGLTDAQKADFIKAGIQKLKDQAAAAIDKGPDRLVKVGQDFQELVKDSITGIKENFNPLNLLTSPIQTLSDMFSDMWQSVVSGAGKSMMKNIVLLSSNSNGAAKIKQLKNRYLDKREISLTDAKGELAYGDALTSVQQMLEARARGKEPPVAPSTRREPADTTIANAPTIAPEEALASVKAAAAKVGKDLKDTGITGEDILKLDGNNSGSIEPGAEMDKLVAALKGVQITGEELAPGNGSLPLTKQTNVAATSGR